MLKKEQPKPQSILQAFANWLAQVPPGTNIKIIANSTSIAFMAPPKETKKK